VVPAGGHMTEDIDLRTVRRVEADVDEPVLLTPRSAGCGGTLLLIAIFVVIGFFVDGSTDCGDEDRRPASVPVFGDWEEYECKKASEAKSVWEYCLQRRQYSPRKGDGCPSSELCCPPIHALRHVEPVALKTDCGSPHVVPPAGKLFAPWQDYTCQNKASAGKSWARCLPRKEYSKTKGRGCKASMRCCPPK